MTEMTQILNRAPFIKNKFWAFKVEGSIPSKLGAIVFVFLRVC